MADCRCYWCNRARGMSVEDAKAEQHRSLIEKPIGFPTPTQEQSNDG